jgi:hypothetical protein
MKARPGTILGIAVASVLLSLGWTGRLAAVFDAMRYGESDNNVNNPKDAQNEIPADIQPGLERDKDGDFSGIVTMKRPDGRNVLVKFEDVKPSENGTCQRQFEKVTLVGDPTGVVYCVDPAKFVTGGGHVIDGQDYSLTMLPTGVFGWRFQPNVKDW